MMVEIKQMRQVEEGARRRWFSDDNFDLIVWEDEARAIVRFELCYDKNQNEHALVWSQQAGHSHHKIDDGEGSPGRHKSSPILVDDGYFDRDAVAARFLDAGKDIDQNVVGFVYDKLTVMNK